MHQKLNSKLHLRLVTTTQASPLTLNERLVYSALLSNADGLTQEGVSSITHLDAKGTVAAALVSLAEHRLAEKQGHRWVALEPDVERSGWFHLGPKGKTWQRRFAYTKLYERSPNCPLTTRQNVIFCTLLSLAAKTSDREDLPQACRGRVCDGLTYEYLAALTGVGVKTVTKTIGLLAELKLAKPFRSTLRTRFALALLEPSDEAVSWFLDKDAEVYPGLDEFLSIQDVGVQATGTLDVPDIDHDTAERAVCRKAAKRSKANSEKPEPEAEPERSHEEPDHGAEPEPEVLPPVPDHHLDQPDPIELRCLQAAEHRRGQERHIEAILLGYGYASGVSDKLSRAFDKPGLPAYGAYKAMIQAAEETFQRNRAGGKYAKVRTSELLLVKWLDHHRRDAFEKADRRLQAHDLTVLNQRLSLVGRTVLERPWEDYEDPITAPFDARLFTERVSGGEIRWDSWGRNFGEQECRRVLVGLPRVRIDEVLEEDGRLEPDEFVERLRAIAPPRSVPRRMTEEEMYQAIKAEMEAA